MDSNSPTLHGLGSQLLFATEESVKTPLMVEVQPEVLQVFDPPLEGVDGLLQSLVFLWVPPLLLLQSLLEQTDRAQGDQAASEKGNNC